MGRWIAWGVVGALLCGCFKDESGATGTDASGDSSLAEAPSSDAPVDGEGDTSPEATIDAPPGVATDASNIMADAEEDVSTDASRDGAVDAMGDAGSDASQDAATDAPLDAASDALPDAPADAPYDAATDAQTGWVYLRIGDCSGQDRPIGYSTGSEVPVPADCAGAQSGLAAVCWDQTTYTNSLVPGSQPGCTYKTISASSCTGGNHPGYLYICNPP